MTEMRELVKEAAEEIRSVVATAIGKTQATRDEAGAAAGAFPNGIELIQVRLEAGLSERMKLTFEVKDRGREGSQVLQGGER